jgi:hypothetical protein
MYSLLRERGGIPVDLLIDINPARGSKFVPATGLRVMSPDEAMTTLAPGSGSKTSLIERGLSACGRTCDEWGETAL